MIYRPSAGETAISFVPSGSPAPTRDPVSCDVVTPSGSDFPMSSEHPLTEQAKPDPVRVSGSFRLEGLRRAAFVSRPSATSGWPPLLAAGHRVELVQGVDGARVYFEARYEASATGEVSAKANARGLARELGYALSAAFNAYIFEYHDALGAPTDEDWPHHYEFSPETCRIVVGRAAGINVGSRVVEGLRLAMERNHRPQDFVRELLPLSVAGNDRLEVVVELKPRDFSDFDAQAAAQALQSLYSPDRVFSDRAPGLPIHSLEFSASLARSLELWLERRRGVDVRLRVRSRAPVSNSLLASLGSTILRVPSGDWIESSAAGISKPSADPRLLDLSASRPNGAPAPAIAPPPDHFDAAGYLVQVPPMRGSLPTEGLALGKTSIGGREEFVRLAAVDRTRHCYVVGATGTGKSTLLFNMALQDIRDGAGLCLLDPHGDLQADLVRALPQSRAGDVIAIDLADTERAIGLNLLETQGGMVNQQVSFAINEILNIFHMLYREVPGSIGPMFEQYMRNALMVLAQNSRGPGSLAEVVPFFENSEFRKAVLDTCTNPAPVSFFTRVALHVTGEQAFLNMAPYMLNKLNRFVGSDFVRPIIGQRRSTLDLRECMDTGKIVLVNLNKGVLGEMESRLVGMLLLAQIFSGALGRAREVRANRRTFHLYVDEAQNFLTPIVGSILAESRKFGLSMTLANQNLAQWDGGSTQGILDAILGNVGTLALFRVGSEDAGRLAKFTSPEFDSRDLQYLPDRTVVAKLLARGRPLRPFTFETLPPLVRLSEDHDDIVAERVRQNFERHSRPRREIEAELRSPEIAGPREGSAQKTL